MAMPRASVKVVVWLVAPCVACGCVSSHTGAGPGPAIGAGNFAQRGAAAGEETLDVAYHGMGGAIGAPLKDFNFAHAHIPPALRRAAVAPYDTSGLGGCAEITTEIAALDLALGPDFDTPDVEHMRDVYRRSASLVADAALDAVRSAAGGYVPMRSVVRRLSGAAKLERRLRRAELAGAVRRGFLKAIGMQQGCGWPAAPLGSPAPQPSPLRLARLSPSTLDVADAGTPPPFEAFRISTAAFPPPPDAAPPTPFAISAGEGGGGSVLPTAARTWLEPGGGR